MRVRARRGGLPQGVTLPAWYTALGCMGWWLCFSGDGKGDQHGHLHSYLPRKVRAVSQRSLHCKDRQRWAQSRGQVRRSRSSKGLLQKEVICLAERSLQNRDHIPFPFGHLSMGARLSGGTDRDNWELRLMSYIYLVIVAQWGRQANFQEEKLRASSCLIIPSSNKVALCFQVAPGRSWVVI